MKNITVVGKYRMNQADDIFYFGNVTCCGSQALLSAYFSNDSIQDIKMFEILTSVPFGIIHKEDDPYRLLTCYYDPDYGLDRALDTLGIPYEIQSWEKTSDGYEAFKVLDTLCKNIPVVLGPLNMSDLTYYFHSELLYRMDHYIVVLGKVGNDYWVCDPEGFNVALINKENLKKAWKGDKIPEGRGGFVLRRVLDNTKITLNDSIYMKAFKYAVSNFKGAKKVKNGSGNALRLLYQKKSLIKADAALQKRLSFDIPIKMQRSTFIKYFVKEIIRIFDIKKIAKDSGKIYNYLDKQIYLFSKLVSDINTNNAGTMEELLESADLEDTISDIFINWEERIQ